MHDYFDVDLKSLQDSKSLVEGIETFLMPLLAIDVW